MKSFIVILTFVSLTACTTTQELKQSQSCKVWKDQPILGPQNYQVNNDAVEVKGQCLFWFWGCSIRKTDIDSQGVIYHQSEGVFSSRTKIASLQGSEVMYEKSVFDKFASSDPVKIDMEKQTAHRKITSGILNMTSEETVDFNSSCKLREAAVGAVAYWVNANKKN